ncbi:Adhesin HecA 20-residue repeat x2 (fragment) [Sterolibacterium denitrificans]|uniref:Adhesin HecA 20-residue repeat x2 n=1 Tax=Sterolibacterium denitrificans TaxID=157592 RepID=A0A7Z7HPL0_9PROT
MTVVATGAEERSDITVQGSSVSAGRDVSLIAEDEIKLLAAENTANQQSSSHSSSASIGVSLNLGVQTGLSVGVAASKGTGQADGQDTAWTNARLSAGETASLASGGDTTLKGAIVEAPQVIADVGGNLAIESLQDTGTYDSQQHSNGFSISVPILGGVPDLKRIGGSIGGGKSNIDSDYASVNEQSGIRAGDEGFDVQVGGGTTLTGGAITSTQPAIDEGKNHFETGGKLTLADITNQAEYEGKGASINLGAGISLDGKLTPQGTSAGVGEDENSAGSMTLATISDIAGNKNARTGDAETGIAPIFDAEKVQREIDAQVQITQTLTHQAHQVVDAYVQTERKSLQEQLKTVETAADKAVIQQQLDDLLLQERVMNVLIGAVTGMGGTALTRGTLSAAADEMRRITIENSERFAGVTDGTTKLDNISGESEGVRGDGVKTGGTRADLDILCGTDNKRCATNSDGSLNLNEKGQVVFLPSEADGKTLAEFLETDEGKKAAGLTGGIQGWKGTFFGIPYAAGSWMDKLVESFGGSHDFLGGQVTGLYDEQGNIKRDMSDIERAAYNTWSVAAIVPSAPFAMAELLPPQVWQAISIFLKDAK